MSTLPTDLASPRRPTRWLTIGIVIGLHAALLLAWRQTREQAPERDAESGPRIQWIATSAPIAAAPLPATPPAPAASAARAPLPSARPRRDPALPAAAPPSRANEAPPVADSEAPAITVVPADPFAEAPPPGSADAIRKRAFADLAKIDKDLQKQSLNKFGTPDDSPQKRLIAGIESARRNPTLFEKAEIEEVTTGNADGGARKYKIKTALGTYCVTYPSVEDPMGKKKYTLCPK